MKTSTVINNNNEIPLAHDFSQYDDDSDGKCMFELPARRPWRPPSTSFKKKINSKKKSWLGKCCQRLPGVVFPVIISVIVISVLLSIGFMLRNYSQMCQDIQLLKIQLKNVEATEQTSVSRREKLTIVIQQKVAALEHHHSSIFDLEHVVKSQIEKLDKLNNTVSLILKHTNFPLLDKLSSIMGDIDNMKTGMAETGADIEELKDIQKVLMNHDEHFQDEMKHIQQSLYNVSVALSELGNKPAPTLSTTPKTLVVTMQPDGEHVIKRKELNRRLKELEEKQKKMCVTESVKVNEEVRKLRNRTGSLEKDIASLFASLSENTADKEIAGPVQSTANSTDSHLVLAPSVASHHFVASSSLNHLPTLSISVSHLLKKEIRPSIAQVQAQAVSTRVQEVTSKNSNLEEQGRRRVDSKNIGDGAPDSKKNTIVITDIKKKRFGNIDRLLSNLKSTPEDDDDVIGTGDDVNKNSEDSIYRKHANLINPGDEYREKRNRGDDELGFYM